MVQRTSLVQQQPHGTIVVGDDDVDRSVVVNVAESGAAAYFREGKGGSGGRSHFAKFFALTLVMKQLIDLIKRIWVCTGRLNAIYRSIGNKQVQPAIIVKVKPFGAETRKGEGRQEQAKFS